MRFPAVVPAVVVAVVAIDMFLGCGAIAPQQPLVDGGSAVVDAAIVSLDATSPFPGNDDDAHAPAVPAAGGLDGVCTPGDVTLGFYDPDCVYAFASTLSPICSG